MDSVADNRECAQCGALFAPLREHARFCSASCRVGWNRQNASSPGAGNGVLSWSQAAMSEVTDRLLRASGWDRPHAYAAITEAVWWCTMVDATLVRYHPDTRSAALARYDTAARQVIEDTFAGLRFVRNQMGIKADPADFIRPVPGRPRPAAGQIAAWTWKPVSEPALTALPVRGREWELTRYRAYQARLAGHRVGDTFSQAAGFLRKLQQAA